MFVSSKVLSSTQSRLLPVWILHSDNIEYMSIPRHCIGHWEYSGERGQSVDCNGMTCLTNYHLSECVYACLGAPVEEKHML